MENWGGGGGDGDKQRVLWYFPKWPISREIFSHARLVIGWKGLVSREDLSKNNSDCKNAVPQIQRSSRLLVTGS